MTVMDTCSRTISKDRWRDMTKMDTESKSMIKEYTKSMTKMEMKCNYSEILIASKTNKAST